MTRPNPYAAFTDPKLVELAIGRDERACRELVDRYHEKVFGLVFGILQDTDHAESAWQETFIRVFKALGTYQPDRAFGNWIARIARNAALDKLEQYWHRLPDEPFVVNTLKRGALPQPLDVADPKLSPLDKIIHMERLTLVSCAMASLKPDHRWAILMDIEGLPHSEIAARMGVPVNTVNTWISRGRECLRQACRPDKAGLLRSEVAAFAAEISGHVPQ